MQRGSNGKERAYRLLRDAFGGLSMLARKFLLLFFGLLGVLAGLAALSGVVSFLVLGQDREDNNFYVTDSYRFERSSRAIISEDAEILTDAPEWIVDLLVDPVDVRIDSSTTGSTELFVGVARSIDVERYLAGVTHDEVTNLDFDESVLTSTDYTSHEGTEEVAAPASQPFWEASSQGTTNESLEWSLDSGDWTIVVMNADGSPGVSADLAFGARVSNLGWIIAGVTAFGLFSVLVGGYMTYRGFRRPVSSDVPSRITETPRDAPSRVVSAHATHEEAEQPSGAKSGDRGNSGSESGAGSTRTEAFFEWVNRHVKLITVGVIVVTVLAVPLAANRSEDDPNFDPTGEIYDTLELTEDRFVSSSPLGGALFIVEARNGGDALTRDVLLEFKENSDHARSNPDLVADFGTQFQSNLGEGVNGVFSLADKVDAALPSGLAGATNADIKLALADILGEGAVGSPLRDTLSQLATSRNGEVAGQDTVIWEAPAFTASVVLDLTDLGGRDTDANNNIGVDGQEFLRKVQTALKGDQINYTTLGIAIDTDLTAEEQQAESSPFILLSVVGIMMLVGALLRSYWAAALVAIGLAATMIWYNAVLTLIGFEGGLLLGFIAPISVIAFGVDFFVHASGRAREQQVEGLSRDRSYPAGLTLVFPALVLAVISSSAAFISNGVAGIQAIVQFGIGTAIALVIGFLLLGIITPRWLLTVEDWLGDPPLERGLMVPYKLGFVLMALIAGAVVTFSVVLPIAGFVALVLFVPLFLYLPMRWTKASYAKAAAAGQPTGVVIKGAGHGFTAAGTVVHFLARWRVFTVPVTLVLAVLGAIGFTQVDSEFSFSDFFSSDSDFIQSIDLLDTHLGDTSGGGSGFIYVEGDLTQPDTLLALDNVVTDLDAAEEADARDYLSRDLNGNVSPSDNAVAIVRTAAAAPAAMASAGIEITDSNGDGIPDSPDQIRAVYDLAFSQGITTDDGFVAFASDSVTELLWTDGAGNYATLVEVGIPTLTDADVILAARSGLDDAAASLEVGPAGQWLRTVSVSGDTVTLQDSLAAFTDAMLLALPVALLLCALLAGLFMRSIKYGIAAVAPILLVVGWVYGFMYLADYKINVVTATIAAIAVGVGIDYSTHFTMRFREEFVDEPSRHPALRRAGEGTGGALAISALSSIIGFAVMAFAPMPIFVTFGTLTAVMIALSLLVSLMVLPSVLLLVTKSRQGQERQDLLDLTGLAPGEYDPHSRKTAVRPREQHTVR